MYRVSTARVKSIWWTWVVTAGFMGAVFAVWAAYTAGVMANTSAVHFDGQSWWAHVKVLADDKLEGRETGSRGERAAQQYVIEQLGSAGISAAGRNGFYQPVRFLARHVDEPNCTVTLTSDGVGHPLVLGEDVILDSRVMPAGAIKAPLVFAGYGLRIPESNYDDFAGLDVRGKLVVNLAASPPGIPGALASHYRRNGERWKALHELGALGVISIANPASMDIPWSRIALNRTAHPSMDLDYPELNETRGEQLSLTVNPAEAEKFFTQSGHTFREIAALAKDHQPLPRFPLSGILEAKTKVEESKVESANLVGKLVGGDPVLKDEYVVLSAHLDHLGIGEAIDGDRIYNGAMDNGSGSALLLDVAASLKKAGKLRRSVLFLFVTGEEKGLLGSRYFATHPTVPPASMVADINVDMFLPIVSLKVLTVYGLGESDLGDRVREVAQSFNVPVQPDPEPQRNVFIRSDQYNFIRQGIPALMMDVGYVPDSPEQRIFKDWLTHRYHAPSDDANQPVDLETAGKYEEIVRALVVELANDDRRPQWKADSFFRRFARNESLRSSQPPATPATSLRHAN